jgi:hypothetical protein
MARSASSRSWILAAWIATSWLAAPTALCAQDDPAAAPERPPAWTGTGGGGPDFDQRQHRLTDLQPYARSLVEVGREKRAAMDRSLPARQFKLIDYFVAPAVGLGYKIVETPATRFSIDLGGGSVTERNPGGQPRTTAGIQAGETLQHDLNATASSIKHSTTAVWNANDLPAAWSRPRSGWRGACRHIFRCRSG